MTRLFSNSRLILLSFIVLASLTLFSIQAKQLEENDCPVCFSIVQKLAKLSAEDTDKKPTQESIIESFLEFCKTAQGPEQRFCYFMGGQDVSATRTYKDMADRIVWGMPTSKICEHLQLRDTQICELRYKKKTDLKTLDVKKLRVADLKRILREYDERCDGCIEKSEFLAKIDELKKKHASESSTDTKSEL